MDEQYALLAQAMARAPLPGAAVDISVSRQYGDNTVTMRTQLGAVQGGALPAPPMAGSSSSQAPGIPLSAVGGLPETSGGVGIQRAHTRNSFYEDEEQVPQLLAEIERLKRKALSRGITLTSAQEEVPAEDVATLRQVFSIADDTGAGEIDKEQLGQLHIVLGEPLTEVELNSAFKAMDANRSGSVSFEDFLSWYTMAHSASGMLSKKGSAYTSRFAKIMNKFSGALDIKNLTTAKTGEPHMCHYTHRHIAYIYAGTPACTIHTHTP